METDRVAVVEYLQTLEGNGTTDRVQRRGRVEPAGRRGADQLVDCGDDVSDHPVRLGNDKRCHLRQARRVCRKHVLDQDFHVTTAERLQRDGWSGDVGGGFGAQARDDLDPAL